LDSNARVPSESPTFPFHEYDRLDIVALTLIERFGPATTRAHLARIRTAGQSIDDGLSSSIFQDAREAARQALAKADRVGARCIIDGEAHYPEAMHALEHPPVALWIMGDAAVLNAAPAVSIVGTRDCSPYGERVTREFATAFTRAGTTVVSGMAVGIDAVAHRAALETNGRTVAVLGTGVDVPYPASHRQLHRQIRDHGVVISEHPPGTRAGPGCFPRRNRIIAALGEATIVVEAGVKSGALNTAAWATSIGRPVGVVPGQIDSPRSLGSNVLMRDGAQPITSVADALALLSLSQPGPATVTLNSPTEQAIWAALADPASDFDVLCARTGLPARVCFETVSTLELRGLVECSLTGELRRR
jgi:DNA processing protein